MQTKREGVLALAYFFNPDTAVGALRARRFHRYLGELGYDSRVITSDAGTLNNDDAITVVPDVTGDFWNKREADIAAGRQPERMSVELHAERFIRKVVLEGHFSIAWSRAAARAADAVLSANPSIRTVISSFPPIGVHLAALRVARAHGLTWVADFRDPIEYGSGVVSQWCTKAVERRIFRHADLIIANTDRSADRFRRLYPWAANKIHVIWNGFDPAIDQSALPVPDRSERMLVHAGSLYHERNANVLLAALGRLRARRVPQAEQVRVTMAGFVDKSAGVDEELHRTAVAEGWLELPGLIPQQQAELLMRQANGLLLLQPPSFSQQVPAKVFQYLRVGRPILAFAPGQTPIEWILSNSGVPFVCIYPDDSTAEVDRKLLAYLDMPSSVTPASEWFLTNFDGRRQTEYLSGLLTQAGRK